MSNQQNNRGGSGRNAGKGGQRGSAKNGKGGNQSNGSGDKNQQKGGSRRRKSSRKKKVDPKVFWGDPDQLEAIEAPEASITTNPSAVVQSLGRPPLSGQQNAAELYFAAVYDRSVNLAAALATAGGLIEPDELTED
ncbi:MAG: hypothetical protein AAF547_20345 [Actinomycetota bacterium]